MVLFQTRKLKRFNCRKCLLMHYFTREWIVTNQLNNQMINRYAHGSDRDTFTSTCNKHELSTLYFRSNTVQSKANRSYIHTHGARYYINWTVCKTTGYRRYKYMFYQKESVSVFDLTNSSWPAFSLRISIQSTHTLALNK